jgi:3-(3-hydroxy-phenyl)propionate hydroxylase
LTKEMEIPVWREIGATPAPTTSRERMPVLIVGAGPVGLTTALDLAQRGHRVTIVNRLSFVSSGSKAICFAKRTLDIWERLGVATDIVAKGVVWETGKVFWGNRPEPIYQFDLLPVKNQKMPAFVNIQQYHVESILIDALSNYENVDIRWGHSVQDIEVGVSGATVHVAAGDAEYFIDAEWLIACDGSRSTVRTTMGLDFEGRVFEDNFLIADIKMKGERPPERWFWFDPPFNPGQSALLHKQPDDIWRLDFQLGWGIDREAAVKPENVEPYVRAMLGEDVVFEPEWYSIYTFQCRRMSRFVHGRVIFAGDAAHLVSPFGARGCNGGIADVDNLCWKLDLVLTGQAPPSLLESYNQEAIAMADENIRHSSRSTDFMSPKNGAATAFRDAVLQLASHYPFARPMVNSGRLSTAVSYPASPLNTLDEDRDWSGVSPGTPALDGPLDMGWLLDRVGNEFSLLTNGVEFGGLTNLDLSSSPILCERFDLSPGSAYLVRPDQVVAARWRRPDQTKIGAAQRRACGLAL